MGEQYAQQLVQIFGEWIMRQHAQRTFSAEEVAELRRWEAEHRRHTPELLDFLSWLASWGHGLGHCYDL